MLKNNRQQFARLLDTTATRLLHVPFFFSSQVRGQPFHTEKKTVNAVVVYISKKHDIHWYP